MSAGGKGQLPLPRIGIRLARVNSPTTTHLACLLSQHPDDWSPSAVVRVGFAAPSAPPPPLGCGATGPDRAVCRLRSVAWSRAM